MQTPIRIVIAGHVDHGKSTLVGRLLHDTGSLPEGRVEAIAEMSQRRGMPFEWAFVMDALKTERDQGITIDTAHIRFGWQGRDYLIVDAPGHTEFLKNMITGAAGADAALLLVDAEEGVREQTRRHGYILHLLGVRQVAVAVNKMDRLDYAEERFHEVAREIKAYLGSLDVTASAVVPISARDGENIVARSAHMPWYEGPTVIESLATFAPPLPAGELQLRLPVQDVYKFDERRLVVGRIDSGTLKVGDQLLFTPSNKTGRIATIEVWPPGPTPLSASAGQSVALTMEHQIFIERGEIATHLDRPPTITNQFHARVFWLGRKPLTKGGRYRLKLATATHLVEVLAIEKVVDVETLGECSADEVRHNEVAELVLRTRAAVALDDFTQLARTGRFVLIEDFDIVGGGIVSTKGADDLRRGFLVRSTNVVRAEHKISTEERWRHNGHNSGVLWLTGLSGSGKSTLAFEMERQLFRRGFQVYVLDGDNIRQGLSADLSFSLEDRTENIRRIAEVANLFVDAGNIVITAFISPYSADRARARSIVGPSFHEVFVKAPLEVCEGRDPKGLYQKARAGKIRDFTGISAPYEEPEIPELTLDTAAHGIDECLFTLMEYADRSFSLSGRWRT